MKNALKHNLVDLWCTWKLSFLNCNIFLIIIQYHLHLSRWDHFEEEELYLNDWAPSWIKYMLSRELPLTSVVRLWYFPRNFFEISKYQFQGHLLFFQWFWSPYIRLFGFRLFFFFFVIFFISSNTKKLYRRITRIRNKWVGGIFITFTSNGYEWGFEFFFFYEIFFHFISQWFN